MQQDLLKEALQLIEAQQEWIDAVPKHIVLPTMPGFDRDWADGLVDELREMSK